MPKIVLVICFGALLSTITACTSLSGAALQGVKAATGSAPNLQTAALQPNFVYLEVHTPNSQALLPLIFEDKVANSPPIDTWMTNDGVVVRTQAGFLASSAGLANAWQNVKYQFDAQGNPELVTFDIPSLNVFGLAQHFKNLGNLPLAKLQTPLQKRAARLQGIRFTVWQSSFLQSPVGAAAKGPVLSPLTYIVGTDPKTGIAVYGLQCMQANYCIEYLLRTAAQNL